VMGLSEACGERSWFERELTGVAFPSELENEIQACSRSIDCLRADSSPGRCALERGKFFDNRV
jgi:hypothetical protein